MTRQAMTQRASVLATCFATLTLAAGCIGDPGGGGCPWTQASDVSVAPASASCLTATLADPSSPSNTGGCVSPDLTVQNDCSETLTVNEGQPPSGGGGVPDAGAHDGGDAETGGSLDGDAGADAGPAQIVIAPGESAEIRIQGHGAGEYVVHGTLGTTAVTFTFTTRR